MTHKESILTYLRRADIQLCDDCLAQELAIQPRQTINQICRSLASQGATYRTRNQCHQCGKTKLVNRMPAEERGTETGTDERLKARVPEEVEAASPTWKPEDDWFWEGNVQQQILRHLESRGWTVTASADTASRAAGPDILATRSGHKLRVSVKGWPSDKYARGPKKGLPKPTRPYNQARHWFAQAIFQLLLQAPTTDLRLALGFPDDELYRNLWGRTNWALRRLGISCFFVRSDGSVEETS